MCKAVNLGVYVALLASIPCTLPCLRKVVDQHFLSSVSIQNDTEHQLFLLLKISFYTATLILFLIAMAISFRVFKFAPDPVKRTDPPRLNLINAQINECCYSLVIFWFIFGLYMIASVENSGQMEELYSLGFTWLVCRVAAVFMSFVSVDLDCSALRAVGWVHAYFILGKVACLTLGDLLFLHK